MGKATETPEAATAVRGYTIHGQVSVTIPGEPDAGEGAPERVGWVELATQDGRNHKDALRQWGRANADTAKAFPKFRVVTASASQDLEGSQRTEFVVS